MEDSGRPSFRGGVGERRMEMVSGRGYNYNNSGNQLTTSRPRSPYSPPAYFPAPSTRPNQVAASSSSSKPWGSGDSEMKRRKRIARYKAYSVEGRVKASIRSGFRWIKNKCSEIIHGY